MADFNWGQQNDLGGTGGWVYEDHAVYQHQTVDPTWLTVRGNRRCAYQTAATPSMQHQMQQQMPASTSTDALHDLDQSLAAAPAAPDNAGLQRHPAMPPQNGSRVTAQCQHEQVGFGFSTPSMRSFQPLQRSMSYAEAAGLPGQYRSLDRADNLGGPQLYQNIRHHGHQHSRPEGIAARHLPSTSTNIRPPAFRLDMRQATPPDMRIPLAISRAATANEQMMNRWLDQPKTVDERMGLHVDTAAMSAKRPTLLSPAKSIAGHSDKSSGRRSRKQRLLSAGHQCPQCGEAFNAAEHLK